MFTVNLKEEMLKEKQKQINVLEEANKLLVSFDKEDAKLISDAGFIMPREKHSIDSKISEMQKSLKEGDLFSLEEIQKVAIKYRLRFLDINYYRGSLPSDLANTIRGSYARDGAKVYGTDFYILAPASSFKLERRPKDPLLFRRTSSGEYRLLRKWGNDLNVSRLIRWLPFRDANTCGIFFLLIYVVYLIFVLSQRFVGLFTDDTPLRGLAFTLSLSMIFLPFILGIVLAVLNNRDVFSANNWDNHYLSRR